jgi:hypothetical protein
MTPRSASETIQLGAARQVKSEEEAERLETLSVSPVQATSLVGLYTRSQLTEGFQ